MVPDHLDDNILDAGTCEVPVWYCLRCSTSDSSEHTKSSRRQAQKEGGRITYYFSTVNHTRRVAS
jgi:hypothetical protein